MTTAFPSSPSLPHRIQSRRVARARTASWAGAALLVVSLLASGCEDKAIGRACDVQADGGVKEALWNQAALECPSRLCIRPAVDTEVATNVDTTALCSAECTKDSDCEDGQTRNKGNPKGCNKGFVCGIRYEVGPLCCKQLCLCKDFLSIPNTGLAVPASCQPGSVSSCANLHR